MPSACPQEHFRKTVFLKKNKLSGLFTHWANKLRRFGKNLGQVCQNCILIVEKCNLRLIFSFRIVLFCRFWTLSAKLWAFWPRNFRTVPQNCFLRVLEKELRNIVFLKRKLSFSIFRALSEKFTASFRKFSSGVVISAFFVSIETNGRTKISRKSFLNDFLTMKEIFSLPLEKVFEQGCKECLLLVHSNFLGNL